MTDPRAAALALASLPNGWDDDGAEPPSDAAIVRALTVIDFAEANALTIDDVDADVCGGVAVHLLGSECAQRRAYVMLKNHGASIAVWLDESGSRGSRTLDVDDARTFSDVLRFLKAPSVAEARAMLAKLSNAEFLEAIEGRCAHCGAKDPRCQCWNDE